MKDNCIYKSEIENAFTSLYKKEEACILFKISDSSPAPENCMVKCESIRLYFNNRPEPICDMMSRLSLHRLHPGVCTLANMSLPKDDVPECYENRLIVKDSKSPIIRCGIPIIDTPDKLKRISGSEIIYTIDVLGELYTVRLMLPLKVDLEKNFAVLEIDVNVAKCIKDLVVDKLNRLFYSDELTVTIADNVFYDYDLRCKYSYSPNRLDIICHNPITISGSGTIFKGGNYES